MNAEFQAKAEYFRKTQEEFQGEDGGILITAVNQLVDFPDYTCIPIIALPTSTEDGICAEVRITRVLLGVDVPLVPGPDTFDGFYKIIFNWDTNTDPTFGDEGGRNRILHARNDDCVGVPASECPPGNGSNGEGFDTDITVVGSYCAAPPCVGPPDPEIAGSDDNFNGFGVFRAPAVPEPATLLLLGSGLSALAYRRLRRRRDSAADLE